MDSTVTADQEFETLVKRRTGESDAIRIGIFGAAPGTSNLGVDALLHSTVDGLYQRIPNVQFTVFDYGLSRRSKSLAIDESLSIEVELLGIRGGRRYDRRENLATMSLLSSTGKLGAFANSNLRAIDRLDAILDVSGGDSFTDLYGPDRFSSVVRPKMIAINRQVPLILLPQTYGPFEKAASRDLARKAMTGANMCWARDDRSFQLLKDMLGDSFNPQQHRCGVDLAFGLKPRNADGKLQSSLRHLLTSERGSAPLIGINVSGLIYNQPELAKSRYRFKADYRETLVEFLRWVLNSGDANVVLVPHVLSPEGHYESDPAACESVRLSLGSEFADRVTQSPATLDQSEVKSVISKLDWFCGTRMHSTIAALSSRVATTTISYSDKAQGVFESCGQGQQVLDPRMLSTEQLLNALKQSFTDRDAIRTSLLSKIDDVIAKSREQLDEIAKTIMHEKAEFSN